MFGFVKSFFKDKQMAKRNNKAVQALDNAFVLYEKCKHPALAPVIIGGYEVWFGANRDIEAKTTNQMDYICALSGLMPSAYFGQHVNMINCPLQDMGGVPDFWGSFIDEIIVEIKEGKKILAYCVGGHGRTGTFGASLISVLEPETPDPIDAMRERHCHKAVETLAQAKAVFALRDTELFPRYKAEFKDYSKFKGSSTKL